MPIIKHCPNCGNTISEMDIEFCTECGHNLSKKQVIKNSKGFFDNLADKTNVSIIIFSFIIFGVFLFIGSMFWSLFISNASIDFITYLLLTVIFSVFISGIFIGYFGCRDQSYVIANVIMFIASIFAALLTGIGLIFTMFMGIIAAISSALSSSPLFGTSNQVVSPGVNLSGIFEIILFMLLIPVAAYFAVYLGYLIRKNI